MNNKSIIALSLAALLGTGTALAAARTPQQALELARSLRPEVSEASTRSSLQVAYTASEGGIDCFYVVDYPDNQGFAIISADDRLADVLGYAESGTFDADNIPCNVAWWLQSYQRQIYLYHAGRLTLDADKAQVETRAAKKVVAPLVSTKWNQDTPYNDLCPLDGGQRSVTGCVATAMAQVMKRWNYPEAGTGAHGGVNFASNPFEWSLMLNEYAPGKYDYSQSNAVANLMYMCGVSVDMMYTSYASGAYSNDVQVAWIEYFKYNPEMELRFRDYYSFTEWNNLVYEELAAGRPVYYSGQSPEGGHAFVCDGYRGNDYFHFNWGWGGAYDGYFVLNALNPSGGGIGSSEGGYNADQMIITNMQPTATGNKRQQAVLSLGSFLWDAGDSYKFQGAENLAYNPLSYSITFSPGLWVEGVTDPNYSEYVSSGKSETLKSYYGIEGITCALPSSMPDGEYRVHPAFEGQNGWQLIQVPYSVQTYVDLKVENGKKTLVNGGTGSRRCELIVNSIQGTKMLAENTNMALRMEISNVGSLEYMGKLKVVFTDPAYTDYPMPQEVYVILPEQRTTEVVFEGKFPMWEADNVQGELMDDNGKVITKFTVKGNAEVSSPDYYDLQVSPVSPNVVYSDEEVVISTVIRNPSLTSDVKTSISLTLNQYGEDGSLTEVSNLSTGEITFPAYNSVNITTQPMKLDKMPAGDYFWIVKLGDGQTVGSAFPLTIYKGPYENEGLTYVAADEVTNPHLIILPNPSGEGYGKNVTIPATFQGGAQGNVTAIQGGTFTFDPNLESISFPATITKINPAEFYGAENLKTISVASQTPFEIAADALAPGNFGKVSLLTPAGTANVYKRTDIWKQFFMPNWTFTCQEGYSITAGLAIDPATSAAYAPYYVSAGEQIEITVSGPEDEIAVVCEMPGKDKEVIRTKDGKATLPAIYGDAKCTIMSSAGVAALSSDDLRGDVYNMQGILVVRNANAQQIKELPAGTYVVAGQKIVVY